MKKIFAAMTAALLMVALVSSAAVAAPSIVKIGATQPTWALGVYSAYYGPPDYSAVSPGNTAVYMGRQAGLIKAGLTADPATCAPATYCDEGLFAFKPAVTINKFAASALTYDVVNQYGTNPVWMTIEIDTGVVGDRTDNVTFQMVPDAYGSTAYVTVNAAAGVWYQWLDNSGTLTDGARTLADIAAQYTGLTVVRTYLRLGMGDSYGPSPTGTQAWVDKASIGGVTYDFVIKGSGYAQKDWTSNPGNHGFKTP
jgi:hypothetical protein